MTLATLRDAARGAVARLARTFVRPRKVRVCFVSTYAYGVLRPESGLPVGGAEIQICTVARELTHDRRFRVSIFTARGEQEGWETIEGMRVFTTPAWGALPTDEPASGPSPSAPPSAGTNPTRAERSSRRRFPGIAAPLAQGIRRAKRAVAWRLRAAVRATSRRPLWADDPMIVRWVNAFRTIGADVYVLRCATPHVGFAQVACQILGKRFVYMVAHEDEVTGAYVGREPEGALFERGLRGADVVICQHGDQLRLFQQRYDQPARHIPSMLPFEIGGPSSTARRTILWIARLDAWKGPGLFIDLAKRFPDQAFVMVGRRNEAALEESEDLMGRIASLPNLQWIDRVPFDGTYALFDDAKIFVNTSTKEGFPNTFLQAAARGTPILSWSVNPDEVLERYDMGVCAYEDWDELVRLVERLSADVKLRERLGENGRRYVRERHGNAAVAAQYAQVFLELAAHPRRGRAPTRAS